jgi:hypothetical protein
MRDKSAPPAVAGFKAADEPFDIKEVLGFLPPQAGSMKRFTHSTSF